MGIVSDRLSLRFVMGVSYALIGIASAALLSHAMPALFYLAAVTFSLGFYAIFGLFPAYISRVVANHQSTFVFAVGNVCLAIGAMIGNYTGGWLRTLSGTFGWTYILIIGLACISLMMLTLLPPESGSPKPSNNDLTNNRMQFYKRSWRAIVHGARVLAETQRLYQTG